MNHSNVKELSSEVLTHSAETSFYIIYHISHYNLSFKIRVLGTIWFKSKLNEKITLDSCHINAAPLHLSSTPGPIFRGCWASSQLHEFPPCNLQRAPQVYAQSTRKHKTFTFDKDNNSYRWIEHLRALGQTVPVGGDGVLRPALQHVKVGSHRLHLIGVVEVSNLFLITQGRNLEKRRRVLNVLF